MGAQRASYHRFSQADPRPQRPHDARGRKGADPPRFERNRRQSHRGRPETRNEPPNPASQAARLQTSRRDLILMVTLQDLIHHLEVGAGMTSFNRTMRWVTGSMAVVLVLVLYDLRACRNFATQEGMD